MAASTKPGISGTWFAKTAVTDEIAFDHVLHKIEDLYRTGRNAEALRFIQDLSEISDLDAKVRIRVFSGMARFDLGDVIGSIGDLRAASRAARTVSISTQFFAAFTRFLRESDFLEPNESIPLLTDLRQLASQAGSAESLASLHLAVARVEGCRGHYLTAHHHLELARSLADRAPSVAMQCRVDLIDASLESLAGNLTRSKQLATASFERALQYQFTKYQSAALTNLAMVAMYQDAFEQATRLVDQVLQTDSPTYVRLGALDAKAQLELRLSRLASAAVSLSQCQDAIARDSLPARSWYDLAHQVTRCAYLEKIGDWCAIVEIAEETDRELARRQYKAVRTAILCAKARAFARLDRHADARVALAAAVRVCPRGAVDPLIVLEASQGLCASVRGAYAEGSIHFDRAIVSCRAIGHRFHEAWITEQRENAGRAADSVAVASSPLLPVSQASILLTDVAAALGAGHSIGLLVQRVVAILQGTSLAERLEVTNESGLEYRPEPCAEVETGPDGACTIRLMGSDRLAKITIRGTQSIDEIALVKSVTDLVHMAIARASGTERQDEDLTLWPRAVVHDGEDTIFRSPRMVELVRIAERLASTNIPVLITGETGTGKEVFARLIHEHSHQNRGPFVPFNCSAVSRELVESQLFGHRRGAFTGAVEAFPGVVRAAERGTLFLDEVSDLDPLVQPKLLRFLESGEIQPVGDTRPLQVAVRIIAATNSSLDTLAHEGRFRRDLFYRIGGAQLALPPLRERKDEIPALAALFLARYASECGRRGLRLADSLIAALLLHDWPGNIRQLANEMRRMVAMAEDGRTLGAQDLAPEVAAGWNSRQVAPSSSGASTVEIRLDQPLAQAVDELERRFIEHALSVSRGRVSDAAQLLGLSRKGLFLKRRRWGLVGGES